MITVHTLNVCKRAVCRYEGRTKVSSLLMPTVNNTDFPPGRFDGRFTFWVNQGINQLKDMHNEEGIMPFADFFHFLQIRNYILEDTLLCPNRNRTEKNTFSNTSKEVSEFLI